MTAIPESMSRLRHILHWISKFEAGSLSLQLNLRYLVANFAILLYSIAQVDVTIDPEKKKRFTMGIVTADCEVWKKGALSKRIPGIWTGLKLVERKGNQKRVYICCGLVFVAFLGGTGKLLTVSRCKQIPNWLDRDGTICDWLNRLGQCDFWLQIVDGALQIRGIFLCNGINWF